MTFTSVTFLLFLSIVFALYWAFPRLRFQNLLLLLASYFFYGWWDWRFCGLMVASSLVDYAAGLALARTESAPKRRLWLGISVCANLGLLGFFKYYNFFVESAAVLLESLGFEAHLSTLRVILPVGISFYTFQTMSYTIDIYRRQLQPCRHLIDYMAYVSFFPQLVAGPIERASNLIPQFEANRTFNGDLATDGLRQMLWGFFKKMVIADNLAPFVDAAYADPAAVSPTRLVMATVFFAFQIYGDFSGYSDIAVGAAKLFSINLMRNFAYPYFSQDVGEFWRRWHISLSTWFRDYLYIPLGGNRAGPVRQRFNLLLTFTVSGFWHGASWNFIVWGFLNGLGVMLLKLVPASERRTQREIPGGEGIIPRFMVILRMGITFAFICLTWVFFRASTWADAMLVVQRVAFWKPVEAGLTPLVFHHSLGTRPVLLLLGLMVLAEWLQRHQAHPLMIGNLPRPVRWIVYTVVLWTILLLGTHGSSDFIYFQF